MMRNKDPEKCMFEHGTKAKYNYPLYIFGVFLATLRVYMRSVCIYIIIYV